MDNNNRIKMTARDEELIETLKMLKIMTSSQIERLFFSHKSAQCRRCRQLVKHKKIKCHKDNDKPWEEVKYYYKRMPRQQVKSMLTVSEFYVRMKTLGIEIVDFQREYSIEIEKDFVIRPDARIIVKHKDRDYEFLVEVDNTKCFSADKYYKAIKSGFKCPPIIAISNHPIRVYSGMHVIKMDMSFKKFDKFIEEYFR